MHPVRQLCPDVSGGGDFGGWPAAGRGEMYFLHALYLGVSEWGAAAACCIAVGAGTAAAACLFPAQGRPAVFVIRQNRFARTAGMFGQGSAIA